MRAVFCIRSAGCFRSCERAGYNAGMDKLQRDRSGEIFQDELTENESKARGAVRDEAENDLHLDSDVDSQEADRAMKDDKFGMNEKSGPQ